MQSRRGVLQYFLAGSGCFTASAFAVAQPNTLVITKPDNAISFPQGIASADPQEDAVMLWTRVESGSSDIENIKLVVQLCEDLTFENIVLQSSVTGSFESDYTVRFFAQGLSPDRIYYYRFITEDFASSPVGRTHTAPKPDTNRKVNFAWVSCQNYEDGFYSAWAKMLDDDSRAEDSDKLDFILHVGDFIYESINAGFRDDRTRALHGDCAYLKNLSGHERRLPPLPSGGTKGKYGGRDAVNLEDYRHIYKEYLKDPNLQAARAKWPFVCIWDDHEFGDNCWQSHLGSHANQQGRLAASQAWFEYVPTVLTQSRPVDGVDSEAEDFKSASVENVPFGDPDQLSADHEVNNQNAINSLHVYRALRYGRNLKLVLTDNRSFRSDHAIPEWWQTEYFSERPLLETLDLIRSLEATGEAANEVVHNNGISAPNPRQHQPAGSMLGTQQKSWWKQSMQNTDAQWKIWANSVPLTGLSYEKFKDISGQPVDTLHSTDTWDGYPTERDELLTFLQQKNIKNVVSLSGDLHAHVTGEAGVIPEFVIAGLASASLYRIMKLITPKSSPLYNIVSDSEADDPQLLNHSLGDSNLHIDYIETDANGYGLVQLDEKAMRVSMQTMYNVLLDTGDHPERAKKIVRYHLRSGGQGLQKSPVAN